MPRTYSTREVAEMWNVSESTVKRWADSKGLHCARTPGGHRRFTLQNLHVFQNERGFEATGLLSKERWALPEVEVSLNKKNFAEVSEQVLYLASRNQRMQIKDLLERLYLRGVTIVELYDNILVPVIQRTRMACETEELPDGQARLISQNLEEAMFYLFPQIVCRRPNGKMGLCATPETTPGLPLNAVARILEVEGWECLNLGASVTYRSMAEMVRLEPVNLVCVVALDAVENGQGNHLTTLAEVTADYRIPLLLFGEAFSGFEDRHDLGESYHFADLAALREYLLRLPHY